MNAPFVIREAIRLGIFCRPELDPKDRGYWIGMALNPGEYFEEVHAASNNYLGLYKVSPAQLLGNWELVTREMIEKEYISYCEEQTRPPF